jgi:uncharacterized membrane protein YdbT with pleckstrin-like domain
VSYVDSHLMAGEKVVYRGLLNRIVYGSAVALLIIALVAWIAGGPAWGLGFLVLALAVGLAAHIRFTTSEFAVTDQRVLIKVGWLQRRSVETLLGKIEGIGVEQGIAGRLFGYGTIIVTGTGGTQETFTTIADPLQFRTRVQEQIVATQRTRTLPETPPVGRDERECPYCAERILVKARVCKHCGREVPSVTA